MHASKLQFHSVGIVGENKKLNSKSIEVALIETMQLYDNEITSTASDVKATVKGLDNKVQEHTITTAATITAVWMPMGEGNRITAPDVRRGEMVMVYKYADADKYFWTTLKEDVRLRKLETVIWAFSGTQVEDVEVNEESYYFFEVSTHNGYIKVHTSMANKEPYTYDIEINTKEGRIVITDSIDNYILLDSKAKRIRMENTDKSFIDIIGKSIFGEAIDSISWKTKDYKIEASNSYTLSTTTNKQSATNTEINSSSTAINSNVAIKGGSLTHNGVNVGDSHTHGGVRSGPSDTSGPK